MTDQENVSLVNEGVEYERKDLKIPWLIGAALSILLVTLAAMGVLVLLMGGLESRRETMAPTPLPVFDARPTPPSPRLQPNPIDGQTAEQQLIQLRKDEEKTLTTYGWVDKKAGIVRVPIDTAIELLTAEQGEPPK